MEQLNTNIHTEAWLIGKESGHMVAYVNITTMSNEDLNILLTHWKSIGRAWEFELR